MSIIPEGFISATMLGFPCPNDPGKRVSDKASGGFASLKIVEIPDDVEWEICEYDGLEWVAEKHRKWS